MLTSVITPNLLSYAHWASCWTTTAFVQHVLLILSFLQQVLLILPFLQ